ncbi:amidohydrolase family protein [Steroidobacter sp.]|uniref:amidohydrolase family protein n=1 Tax=Steroidobacter sp. TaxID=1978227 RepID=UPI001A609D33|nr:amidohydrolase family protein [Steroidobacter sp.]MBL8267991.1 amidohydrolase family protein [Steroidobacter sp.]
MNPSRSLLVIGLLVAHAASAAPDLIIANVRIVDVTQGVVTAPADVSIEHGRISAISPVADAERDVPRIEAAGAFLAPGYWDMHVHLNHPTLAERWALPLFLASGVVAVRDMAGDCLTPGCKNNIKFMRDLQRRIDTNVILGPRIVAISSAIVNGPRAAEPGDPAWATPATYEQGRALARRMKARGVDFIKPYDTLPRDAYFGMMDEARRLGLPVSGHIPHAVSTLEALAAGQRGIEHAKHPAVDCSRFSRTFRDVVASWTAGDSPRIYRSWADPARGDENLGSFYPLMLATFDASICQNVIAGMASSSSYYIPTLITRKFEAFGDDVDFLDDSRLRLVPASIRSAWQKDSANFQRRFQDPQEKRSYVDFYELAMRLVGQAHEAGVHMLVGTDSSDSYCFPGSGFHDELKELSRAGLSNQAILFAATAAAAQYMGQADRVGTVSVGKQAELVLLDANPLEDIANAARIRAVIRNGKVLDAKMLSDLEANVARFVAEPESQN